MLLQTERAEQQASDTRVEKSPLNAFKEYIWTRTQFTAASNRRTLWSSNHSEEQKWSLKRKNSKFHTSDLQGVGTVEGSEGDNLGKE